jgi:CYTH domain-containing protein
METPLPAENAPSPEAPAEAASVPQPPPTVTRKFLVSELPKTLALGAAREIETGYLCVEKDGPEMFIRRDGTSAALCYRTDSGLQHQELETPLSPEQLAVLWPLTEGRRACKKSYQFLFGDVPMTLDMYQGRLNWLRIAEAEFKGRGAAESFSVPSWLYREITDIIAYRNSNLSRE